jgi:ribosome biogenesis GTPase A
MLKSWASVCIKSTQNAIYLNTKRGCLMAENTNAILSQKKNINWFPGHMAKAIRQVKNKIKLVDLIIEVRDARVALSSGNRFLDEIIGNKSKLIVLNKSNLAESENIQSWKIWFKDQNQPAVFINALNQKSIKGISDEARKMMKQKWEKFIKKQIAPPPLRMMIVGVPNTGKSTLINRLTKRNAAKTGDRPGVTQSQEWIVLGKDLELLDTPGIMPSKIDTKEQGLWLCAIHAIKDEIVGKVEVATFLLEYLLKKNTKQLHQKYNIDFTSGLQVDEYVLLIGERLNFLKTKGEIDFIKTCDQILSDFRKGLLGHCSFEFPPPK